MRKSVFSLFLAGFLTVIPLSAQVTLAAKPMAPSPSLKADDRGANLQEAAAVQEVLRNLLDASNRHDIEGVLRHYSPNFTSGDSLNLKDVRSLIQDTWKMFPDIKYESQVLDIRINGDWATVESIDTATASARIDPTVSSKPGVMKSRSRGMLYLHRLGKHWEIVSDATLYEKAAIAYGPVDQVNVDVEMPEQVFAGDPYTAKVIVGVPSGNIAFATLTQEALIYPQHAGKDKFRTLSSDKTELERIFKANTTNNNEVVTATVGLTEIGQDAQERPVINLKGVLTVVKRVNVISKSDYKDDNPAARAVHTTADGKIKVDPTQQPSDEDNEMGSPGQPGFEPVPQD